MKVLALDIARQCGLCVGEAGAGKPVVSSHNLARKGEGYEAACQKFAPLLRDWIRVESPDLIAVEHWLHPLAQPSADAVIMQLHLHGVVRGIAGCKAIPIRMPTPDEVRVHFCGQKSAMKRTHGPKTPQQKAEARKATKQMVINRAILLGYLPHGCTDDNMADAAALFDYACAHYARVQNQPLHLFNEAAP
jgi:Holliday junction resolvasome RuvABC endonuclease subunit